MQTENTQLFEFHIDQCIEMWTRSKKYVKATSQEEANSQILNQIKDGTIYNDLDDYEYLYDTQTDTSLIEILDKNGNKIEEIINLI
jgi:hypothetical protein